MSTNAPQSSGKLVQKERHVRTDRSSSPLVKVCLNMASFLSKWLSLNKSENEETFNVPSPDSILQYGGNQAITKPSDISFENDQFKLVVKIDSIKRNHRFKVVDRQFNILIVPKTDQHDPPLIEMLQFLEDGFKFILMKIRAFINPSEHRIAYLSLIQQPMVIAYFLEV